MEQILAAFQETPGFQGHVPGDLFHPVFIWMWSHPGQADLATLHMNEEQDIVSDQSLESDNFNGEEIGSSQNIQMSANEVLPTGGVLPLGSGRDVVATEDIAYVWSDSWCPRLAKAPTIRS